MSETHTNVNLNTVSMMSTGSVGAANRNRVSAIASGGAGSGRNLNPSVNNGHHNDIGKSENYHENDNDKPASASPASPSKSNGNGNTSISIVDNPCWGGPLEHQHDLARLLDLIAKGKFGSSVNNTSTTSSSDINKYDDTIVIYNDSDYLVIDKPPDLRMDGPYPATVHKLVTYWFPPPSLTKSVMNRVQEKQILLLRQQKDNALEGTNVNININGTDDHDHDHDHADRNDDQGNRNDENENDDDDDDDDQHPYHEMMNDDHVQELIHSISKLTKHNDLPDNIIRPTHQLDYATSGTLLLAKSRKAAGIACQAFQNRQTKKEYLAIVHHSVDGCGAGGSSCGVGRGGLENYFPTLTTEQEAIFESWMNGALEDKYRKEKKNDGRSQQKGIGKTFVGFMPAHSIFAKWKGLNQHKRKSHKRKWEENHDIGNGNNHGNGQANGNADHNEGVTIGDRDKQESDSEKSRNRQLNAVLLKPSFLKDEEDRLMECGWKEIKRNQKYKEAFQDMAKEYNDTLRNIQDQEKGEDGNDGTGMSDSEGGNDSSGRVLPTFFRCPGESEDAFYVQAPLAEDPNLFQVFVNPDSLQNSPHEIRSKYSRSTTENGKELDFRPSLTRCVVLKRGFWNGLPVTKVLLQPWTGRRHQLRIHMAITGHAILGDVTYEQGSAQGDQESKTCNRMCLHAHKLSIPLVGGSKNKVFIAPDPFVGVI